MSFINFLQNPPTIITVIFTGLLTLGASLIVQHAVNKREKQRVLLTKAEELFTVLNKMKDWISSNHRDCQLLIDLPSGIPVSVDKIYMLISLYFQYWSKEMEQFRDSYSRYSSSQSEFWAEYKKHGSMTKSDIARGVHETYTVLIGSCEKIQSLIGQRISSYFKRMI